MLELYNWFIATKLTLSLDKTNFSIFHHHRKKIPDHLDSMMIDTHKIDRVTSVKYLGVILDDTLNWKEQIGTVSDSLTKYISSFKIIKHLVPEKCKRQLYFAYIHSKIKYGLEIYGHTTKSNLKKLQVLQNKALKVLFNKDWFTSTNLLHKQLNLLTIIDMFNESLLHTVFSQRRNLLPKTFDNYFISRHSIHNIPTRYSNKINIPLYKTN